ncbi:MAG: class II aldolase/adducin family protein [Gammaproteobacteria bacterium]|nr:class II aldolase/adducin family protein [Gammaproteobacteria bacterium]
MTRAATTGPGGDETLRAAVVEGCRWLVGNGLVVGTAGNVSARRDAEHFFVSPTGTPYHALRPEDVALVDLDGRWRGGRRPSSEWRIHRDLYRARPEIGAVVHTHSREATALACTGRGIPAFHYQVAAAGGADVRCAPYRPFGTQALSEAALVALAGRRACLLANHGVLCVGADLDAALGLAAEIEDLAAKYRIALGLGRIEILDAAQMREVLDRFATYGRQDGADPDLVHAADPSDGSPEEPR